MSGGALATHYLAFNWDQNYQDANGGWHDRGSVRVVPRTVEGGRAVVRRADLERLVAEG